jgi:hypothetical protein
MKMRRVWSGVRGCSVVLVCLASASLAPTLADEAGKVAGGWVINVDLQASYTETAGATAADGVKAAAPDTEEQPKWNVFHADVNRGATSGDQTLVNSAGRKSGVSLSVTGKGGAGGGLVSWVTQKAQGVHAMMREFHHWNPNEWTQFTFSGVPTGAGTTYDLYVYCGADNGEAKEGPSMTVKVGAEAREATYVPGPDVVSGTFTEGTNFVRFTGLTPTADGTIAGSLSSIAPSFNGMQLVAVPARVP